MAAEKVKITCICKKVWESAAKPENRKCPDCGETEALTIEPIEVQPPVAPPVNPPPKTLTKEQARKKLLEARLVGPNVHQYALAMRRAWKRELQQIKAGEWRGPIKARTARKVYDDVVG